MSIRKLITGTATLMLGGALLANHVPAALSSIFGSEVLTNVTYVTSGPQQGVVVYVKGHDHEIVHHLHGSYGFDVSDHTGATENVTFAEFQFPDIHNVPQQDAVDAINEQLTIAEAVVLNGHIFLRGTAGGDGASLTLTDQVGGVLGNLGLDPGTHTGATDIRLTVSIPAEDDGGPDGGHPHELDHAGALAFHPYLIVASTSDGMIDAGNGHHVPFAWDATSEHVLRATEAGLVDGFFGWLDGNEDAEAVLSAETLAQMWPQGLPERVELALVVFSPDLGQVEFVSQVFGVDFVD